MTLTEALTGRKARTPATYAASMDLEPLFRIAGGVLQLAGVWTVAWEIHQANKKFAPDRIGRTRRRFRRSMRRLFRRTPEVHFGQGQVQVTASASGSGIAQAEHPEGPDLEGKVDELFRRHAKLRDDLNRHRAESRKRQRETDTLLKEERRAREQADRNLEGQVKTVATSGVRIRWYGIVLLTAGILLVTFAPELARWVAS